MTLDRNPIPVIAGPTAIGKTALSLDVAHALDAEIISADSRQVYREMSIGTAKPSPEELERIQHHFIDERSISERYSAGIFGEEATLRIDNLLAHGKRVVVVGGSTLYLHALMYGLASIPVVDQTILDETNKELQERGSAGLHDELRKLDPAGAERIDPTKSHRLVRALSVRRATGRPLASFFVETKPDPRFRLYILERDRAELYDRINRRVELMLEDGLHGEVKRILADGFDPATPPLRTIGYRELIEHQAGSVSYDESVRLIKRNSRRYAKRQMTWFRKYEHARLLPANDPDRARDVIVRHATSTSEAQE